MPTLCRLDVSKDEVANLERPLPDVAAVIPAQSLLVFFRSEESDVACFIDLIHCVFERGLVALLVVGADPRGSVIEVGG